MGAPADAAILAARRARIMERLGDGAVLLLAAAPERVRSADVLHPYRQDSDFGYVTGFPELPTGVGSRGEGAATSDKGRSDNGGALYFL